MLEIAQLPLADLQQLLVALPLEINKRRTQQLALVRTRKNTALGECLAR